MINAKVEKVAKKRKVIQTVITDLNDKGNGIGKILTEEMSVKGDVEVPFAIPGDTVQAEILKKRKDKKLAVLQEIIDPSPERIAPRCIHFSECGGCRWQNMPYEKQLYHKEKYVESCFASILPAGLEIQPIIPCESEWNYRNKMEFSFSEDAAGNRFLGLMKDSSKGRVVNLTECHLVSPWFMEAVQTVRHWWKEAGLQSYKSNTDKGALRTLVIRESKSTGDRLVMLTVSANPDYALHKNQLESFVSQLRAAIEPTSPNSKLSLFLRIQQVAKGVPTNFYEMLLYGPDHIREVLDVQIAANDPPEKLHFRIGPTAFFQPNPKQASRLYSTVLQLAGIPNNSIVYDLYCGTGTLGICTAKKAKQVIGIEISPESVLNAKANAAFNSITNFTVFSGAVRHMLNQLHVDKKYPFPDLLVLDPPRPGLDPEAMKAIISMNVQKILYVSCNPKTCAANIAELIKYGYRIVALQPIDQFPQTPHVEMAIVIEKVN